MKAKVLSWGNGSFELALTAPTWLDKGDDAVNGPGGDWAGAKDWLPIFVTDEGLYVVANLSDPACPTGWYHEEECGDEGPSTSAPSLDAFLSSLGQSEDDDVVRPADPDQQRQWSQDFADDGPRAFDAARDD